MESYTMIFEFEINGVSYTFSRVVDDKSYSQIVQDELARLMKQYNTTDVRVRRVLL